jgi:prophage maintenance system killer protein
MVRFHKVNGVQIQFTAEEEAQKDLEEQQWLEGAFDRSMENLRDKRNALLSQTDYLALSDQTMTAEMTAYRQALRDITNGLTTVEDVEAVVFPEKPEV